MRQADEKMVRQPDAQMMPGGGQVRKETRYRGLRKGETVLATDEIYDDARKEWCSAEGQVGKPAPDPRFTAHRQFRRALLG